MTERITEWNITEQVASQYEEGCGCLGCGAGFDEGFLRNRQDPRAAPERHSAIVNSAS